MLVYQRVPFFVVRWFHTGPCRPFFFREGRTKELSITPRSTKQHLVGQWWRWYGICSVAFPHVWYACYTVYDYIITNHYIPVLYIYILYAWLINYMIKLSCIYILCITHTHTYIYIYHCLYIIMHCDSLFFVRFLAFLLGSRGRPSVTKRRSSPRGAMCCIPGAASERAGTCPWPPVSSMTHGSDGVEMMEVSR